MHQRKQAKARGGCVHTCTVPAKAPTTTGAILPAAVNTEKNPWAVPVKQETRERYKSHYREVLCRAFLKRFLSQIKVLVQIDE
jgi:hypothetical protein